ncbi:MAG: PepSY domain-containing protein [Paracoccaceae bacterium]|nr:PepSY domain-containing protein [Paracoccaceae bacterium]
MRRTTIMVTLLAGAGLAGAAMAEEDGCRAPMANWQPRAAVESMAEAQGWTDRNIRAEGGCYAIRARDAEGHRMKARVDPATLRLVGMEHEGDDHEAGEDDEDDGGAGGPKAAPAGTVAPPGNGLFRKGGAGVIVK